MFGLKRVATIGIVVMALVLSACGGGSGSDDETAGTLRLGTFYAPATQAAANADWVHVSPYFQAVYDTLLRSSPDAEVEPWLATSWEYNEDNTVLTLQLRDDVKFSDGQAFTAEVAAQNLLRFRDGTSPNKSHLASVSDVVATGPSTVQINLSQPNPALLLYLTQNAGLQESPAAFDAPDAKTNPIGSGPYILDTEKTVIGSKYIYTKNPDYWAEDEQHFETLEISAYSTNATQVNALKGGQADGLNLGSGGNASVDELVASGLSMNPVENLWQGLFLLDRAGTMNPALQDVRVRQAINHAIDREAMLEAVVKGHGTVTTQIFPPGSPAYDPELDDRYPFDPAKAEELLAEAGYSDGLTIKMPLVNVSGTTNFDLTKQYLADVGITVEYEQVALEDAAAGMLAPKWPAILSILPQEPTAWQVANNTVTPNATWNPFDFADPKVAELIQIMQTGSGTEADDASKELNEYIVEQAWFSPWFRVEQNFATSDAIEVVQQLDSAYPYLWNITPKS